MIRNKYYVFVEQRSVCGTLPSYSAVSFEEVVR